MGEASASLTVKEEGLQLSTIQCRERGCNNSFEFSDGEAKFYQEKGYTPPTRCKPCREARKREREGSAVQAANVAPIAAPLPPPPVEVYAAPRKRVVEMDEERKRPRKERTRRDTRVRYNNFDD